MSTNSTVEEESITVLHESSGPSENNTLTEPVSRVRNKHTSRQWRRCKFRGIGSNSVLLIIIWTFIIYTSLALAMLHNSRYSSVWKSEEEYMSSFMFVFLLLSVAVVLTEVVISRYKLVRYSVRAMWVLSIIDTVFKIFAYTLSIPFFEIYYVNMIVFVLPYSILLAVFSVSAIPLGMDQIMTGSNDNISSFVQWMVWTCFCGLFLAKVSGKFIYHCTSYGAREVTVILSLVTVLLLSVGLILDFLFAHKLVQEPVTVNPVTLIFKVVKYAAKHKYPVRRSAFTYCDDQQPSRLDYGKSKYGGPFTTEQVEDVKTFWRITLVTIVLSCLVVPQVLNNNYIYHSIPHSDCTQGIIHTTTDIYSFVTYFIPVYELLVYPFLRHRGPRILQSIGIGAAALIFSSLYGLTAETIQYYTSNEIWFNYFTISVPVNIILALTTATLVNSSLQFICAQGPYNMRALLFGFILSNSLMFFAFAMLLCVALRKIKVLDSSGYGVWYHLTTLVLAVVSSVLLVCVIRWYKTRERDEIVNYQGMVEDIHYKYQQQEA